MITIKKATPVSAKPTVEAPAPAAITPLPETSALEKTVEPIEPPKAAISPTTELKPIVSRPTDGLNEPIWIDGWLLTKKGDAYTLEITASKPPDSINIWPGTSFILNGLRGPLLLALTTLTKAENPETRSATPEHEEPAIADADEIGEKEDRDVET